MSIELDPLGSFEVSDGYEPHSPFGGWSEKSDRGMLLLVGTCSVDPAGFELVEGPFWADEEMTKPIQTIDCPETRNLGEGVLSIVGAISFATGISFEPGSAGGLGVRNEFTPDNAEDARVLAELGTSRCRLPIAGTRGVEVFGDAPVDAGFITALAQRHAVYVYSDVLSADDPASKFRELWRVLELSFQAHGRDLVELLENFQPVRNLGFDRAELESLRALRGRLSHAASRLGHLDVGKANTEAIHSLGRLWSLVDWVILAKKESSRSLEIDELQPLAAYITEKGPIEFVADVGDRDEWVETWGTSSVRFRDPGPSG